MSNIRLKACYYPVNGFEGAPPFAKNAKNNPGFFKNCKDVIRIKFATADFVIKPQMEIL
jgi:hypothetical protein